jgi:hypothetical protein
VCGTVAAGGTHDEPFDEKADEELLAKYESGRCKGCGYHPTMGCASSCPILYDARKARERGKTSEPVEDSEEDESVDDCESITHM